MTNTPTILVWRHPRMVPHGKPIAKTHSGAWPGAVASSMMAVISAGHFAEVIVSLSQKQTQT